DQDEAPKRPPLFSCPYCPTKKLHGIEQLKGHNESRKHRAAMRRHQRAARTPEQVARDEAKKARRHERRRQKKQAGKSRTSNDAKVGKSTKDASVMMPTATPRHAAGSGQARAHQGAAAHLDTKMNGQVARK